MTGLRDRFGEGLLSGSSKGGSNYEKTSDIGAAIGIAAGVLALTSAVDVVHANPACGATLTVDTTLDGDLTCTTTPGLIIGAAGITLDLGGFTLSGLTCGGCHGVRIVGFDDVQIENGTIDGFEQGVRAEGVVGLELKYLEFTGQTSSHAIDILDSEDVEIKYSTFDIPVTSFLGPEAIRLESVDGVEVKNVDITGGWIGVNFACGSCDGTEDPTNGEVKDSILSENVIGVLIANSIYAGIKNNEIKEAGTVICGFCGPATIFSKGVSAGGFGVIVSGVIIEDNVIHDNEGIGIQLWDVDGSEVFGNVVTENDQHGISLIIGSTGNEVTSNLAEENGDGSIYFDMFHDGASTPNEWEGNSCLTSSGADIDCP